MSPLGLVYTFLLLIQGCWCSGKVLELSDRFLSVRKEGLWLLKFYAPWCGHCKKLEPVWKHVAQSLADTDVRVGRVDCTRFTQVGQEFGIRGYPTIVFLKGEDTYTYEGDRTRQDIVMFARRMMGPSVSYLSSWSELDEVRANMGPSQPFFLYVGGVGQGGEGDTFSLFSSVAARLQRDEFMYSAESRAVGSRLGVKEGEEAVLVFKDDNFYRFRELGEEVGGRQEREAAELEPSPTMPTTVVNSSLYNWVLKERFPRFVKVTRGKFSNLLNTGKYLVLAVLEENKLLEVPPSHTTFRDLLSSVSEEHRDRYHQHFQFGWTGSPDLANSVAMETLSLPALLVINSTTYQHHLPSDPGEQLTGEAIHIFLDSIIDGEAPSYGGSGWLVRLYRSFYEGRTALSDMWRGNPVLTAVLLGLPAGFLSLIFYSICCADIMDAEEAEDTEEETSNLHEKYE